MINAKRVKQLRKSVRQFLSHLPKVAYATTQATVRWMPDFDRGLGLDGAPTQRPYEVPGAVVLDKMCQRFAYKAAKKSLAAQRLAHG